MDEFLLLPMNVGNNVSVRPSHISAVADAPNELGTSHVVAGGIILPVALERTKIIEMIEEASLANARRMN